MISYRDQRIGRSALSGNSIQVEDIDDGDQNDPEAIERTINKMPRKSYQGNRTNIDLLSYRQGAQSNKLVANSYRQQARSAIAARDLENQIQYSFDINDNNLSSLSDVQNSIESKSFQQNDKACLGLNQKRLYSMVIYIDCVLLIRLLPAIISFRSTDLLKFYYYFRLVTFIGMTCIILSSTAYFLFNTIRSDRSPYATIAVSLALITLLIFDYYFCIVVRNHLMRTIKKDRKKQRKIKGRMLSQKSHKGWSVRIDTPPPFHASNDHKSIGSRGQKHKIHPSSHSQRYNLSRTKTLHRAKSDSGSSMSGIDQNSFKKYRKRRSSFQSMRIPRPAAGNLELSVRGAGEGGKVRGRGKSFSRERRGKHKRNSSYGRDQREAKYLVAIEYEESAMSSSQIESVNEPTSKNHHVKIVNTVTSSAYYSKGTRSMADFTNPDKKSQYYQSGISVSHKNMNDVKLIDFRDKTGKTK